MNTLIKREQDYALRICAFLAGCPPEHPIAVSQLAEKLYITVPFATKIIHKLKNNNIIGTVQGKFGGVYLLTSAKDISVYDVLCAMEFEFHVNACLKLNECCPCEAICKLHVFFAEQENELLKNFKAKKISDVAI